MAVSASFNITANLPTNYQYYTSGGLKHALNADRSYFTLNDKLISIYSGAMHYFRVPRAYWRDRLRKMRAAGLNTVETYVPWNLHEPESGKYDFGNGGSEFEDFLHLEEFLATAKEEDLFVILRTGPYICSEYNFGGFPSWLLREKEIGFRTSESTYIRYVDRYFKVLLTLLSAFQFLKGGPVIAFQVENEYGNQEGYKFQPDRVYLRDLQQMFVKYGINSLLTTADTPTAHADRGSIPGLFLQTANFGGDPNKEFDKLQQLQPGKPLMSMEYWVGWFNTWGSNPGGKSDQDTERFLREILQRNASFNAYMFHGGTNFAFNSGASLTNGLMDNSGLMAITTSYDYDAPLTENGAYRSKYYVFKKLVAQYNPVKTLNPAEPTYVPPVAYNSIKIEKALPFSTIIEKNAPLTLSSKYLLPMEKLDINGNSGQSNGYIVYRKENVHLNERSVLTIEGNVCDHVLVLVNGQLIAPKQLKTVSDLDGFGFNRLKNSKVTLNAAALNSATIDLIVEDMGRMNGGYITQYNHTFKGLWQGNVLINNQNILDWKIVPLELKKKWVNGLQGWINHSANLVGPVMYSSVLKIDGNPRDTFVDVRGWGKGMVFVNGFPLGRYVALGPQRSLYLPAPFLQKGTNQINFFEHFYTPGDNMVKFADKLIYENVH